MNPIDLNAILRLIYLPLRFSGVSPWLAGQPDPVEEFTVAASKAEKLGSKGILGISALLCEKIFRDTCDEFWIGFMITTLEEFGMWFWDAFLEDKEIILSDGLYSENGIPIFLLDLGKTWSLDVNIQPKKIVLLPPRRSFKPRTVRHSGKRFN